MSEFSNINYFVNAMPVFAYFSAEMFMRNTAGLDQPSYKCWIFFCCLGKGERGKKRKKTKLAPGRQKKSFHAWKKRAFLCI